MSARVRDKAILDCIEYMKKMHEGQIRRVTNAPYYIHPLTVLGLMEEAPFFFALRDKQAALLHDVQEDSPLFSWEELCSKFGPYVAGAVALLSKTKLGTGSPTIYFAMLQHASPNIMAIKLLDRLANTSDYDIIRDVKWLQQYLDETIQLALPLIQVMVSKGSQLSPHGYFELGTWIDDRLQANLHGMQSRIRELREK
jgi:(p)ppGpp synthase/HD superfamily hydrolase